jgi:hypothetical protein
LRAVLLAGILIVATACGGTSSVSQAPGPSSSPTSAPSVSPSASAVAERPSGAPSTAAPATATPTEQPPGSSPTAEPPILSPELCPTTLPAADHETEAGILIAGDDEFVAHAERALALLEDRAPEPYVHVIENIIMLRQVDAFSGMCYDTGTYRVGEETAYAPGYPEDQQVVWLAGTIVHDGCHRARFVANLEPGGRDGELACLIEQVEALELIEDGTSFRDYVQGLIDTIDDPASQYWNNPDRHW